MHKLSYSSDELGALCTLYVKGMCQDVTWNR